MTRYPSPAERLSTLRQDSRMPPLLVPFYGHRPTGPGAGPWVLSNFWPARFVVADVRYAHVEQFMMADKAGFFGDAASLATIMSEQRPFAVKKLGRAVSGFDKPAWDARCYATVLEGVLAKFAQNAPLGLYLASTAPAVLVEAAPTDRIWGVGLTADDPAVSEPRRWRGTNLLGFALTEARERLFGH